MRVRFVLFTIVLIGALDFATGVFLLLSPKPWLAHGPATLWSTWGPGANSPEFTLSLFRRVGAFSLYAGTVTLVWAWLGRTDRRLLSALLITYTVVGPAFAYGDNAYFAGTPYLWMKQGIGAVWVVVLLVHFWPREKRLGGDQSATSLGA